MKPRHECWETSAFRRALDVEIANAEWIVRYGAIAEPWVAWNAPHDPLEVWAEVVDSFHGFS